MLASKGFEQKHSSITAVMPF